jgi:hypothetical protein
MWIANELSNRGHALREWVVFGLGHTEVPGQKQSAACCCVRQKSLAHQGFLFRSAPFAIMLAIPAADLPRALISPRCERTSEAM